MTLVRICTGMTSGPFISSSNLLFSSTSHAFNIGVCGLLYEILHKHFCSVVVLLHIMPLAITKKQTLET